jgi:hypothetical protein
VRNCVSGHKKITEVVYTAKVNTLRLKMNTKMWVKYNGKVNKAYPGKASRSNREIRCANK